MVMKVVGKCTASMKILSHLGSWFIVWDTFPGLLDLEDEDIAILQDIGNKFINRHGMTCQMTNL
jgi:hypothetical protein